METDLCWQQPLEQNDVMWKDNSDEGSNWKLRGEGYTLDVSVESIVKFVDVIDR